MTVTDLDQLSLTSAGTAELISADPLQCESVIFTCPSTNTGACYIGSSAVSSTRFVLSIAAGSSASISVSPSAENDTAYIDLGALYWDGATTGNKLNVGYMANR